MCTFSFIGSRNKNSYTASLPHQLGRDLPFTVPQSTHKKLSVGLGSLILHTRRKVRYQFTTHTITHASIGFASSIAQPWRGKCDVLRPNKVLCADGPDRETLKRKWNDTKGRKRRALLGSPEQRCVSSKQPPSGLHRIMCFELKTSPTNRFTYVIQSNLLLKQRNNF